MIVVPNVSEIGAPLLRVIVRVARRNWVQSAAKVVFAPVESVHSPVIADTDVVTWKNVCEQNLNAPKKKNVSKFKVLIIINLN